MIVNQNISRRSVLKKSAVALSGLTVLQVTGPSHAFAQAGREVIPWLDQPPPSPFPTVGNLLKWEELDSRLTPTHNFFFVSHYGQPTILDELAWRVDIRGLVARPQSFSLADLKALARHEVEFTLECSGNTGLDFFIGGIGNARLGRRAARAATRAGGHSEGGERGRLLGADSGRRTIRDNTGIVSAGRTGIGEPDANGGIDLTITEQFAPQHVCPRPQPRPADEGRRATRPRRGARNLSRRSISQGEFGEFLQPINGPTGSWADPSS